MNLIDVIELNARYGEALDRFDLAAWKALFTPDAVYRAQARENFDGGLPLAAIYLDAAQSLIEGKTVAAKDLLKQIVEKYGNEWMDPVYIAAEVDYAKILKAEGKKQKAKRKK